MQPMNRYNRVLKLLVLLAVILIGVGLWVTRTPPSEDADWVSNPFGSRSSDTTAHPTPITPPAPAAPSAPAAAAPAPAAPKRAATGADTSTGAAAGPAVRVIRLLTTPESIRVGAMTGACREALRRRGPWKDAAAGKPWPECVDAAGRPMVVQFCSYLLLSSGRWVPSENTRDAARCRAELPEIRRARSSATSR
jgi:hypothetical protein